MKTKLLVVLAFLATRASAQATIVVSPTGSVRTVASAVAKARAHDRVLIKAGVYREPTIVVSKPLVIVGENYPVLDGEWKRQIMTVTADSVRITGIRFAHVGAQFVQDPAAIKVIDARGCVIDRNVIDDSFFGIYLARVDGCTIEKNRIHSGVKREMNAGNGIHLWRSNDVRISGNTISGQRDGIYFEFVHNSVITGNTSERNLRYGLHFMFSDDCRYIGNTFRANGAGVAVMFTRRVQMVNNRFEENWGGAAYGLFLKEISDSELENNVFRRNTVAFVADGANRLKADRNDFYENGWAVKLEASTDQASFTNNNFAGNTFDVASNGNAQSTTFTGNYWQDYSGYDLNKDGRGDVPHHPVRLFSVVVANNAPSIILLRSPFVKLLDAAERVIPALTPESVVDTSPSMQTLR